MIIEICASNEMAKCLAELEAQQIDVIIYPCLDRCESCLLYAYVYANGELIERSCTQAVLDELVQIKANEDQMFVDEEW